MGTTKATLALQNESFLGRVVRIVAAICEPVFVVASPNQNLPNLPNDVVICHDTVAYSGPARALAQAFPRFPKTVTQAFVTGCDSPFITTELIGLFITASNAKAAVVARIGDMIQPLPALYPIDAFTRSPIAQSLMDVLTNTNVICLDEKDLRRVDPDLIAFQPVNTPEEYELAKRRAEPNTNRK